MNTRTLAYKFIMRPRSRQARELDRWCNVARYAWNWCLGTYESALDELRAAGVDENGKAATGSVRDILERRMYECGVEIRRRGKGKEDTSRTLSLKSVIGALFNHHRKTEAPSWVREGVHSQVSGYACQRLCDAVARWWDAPKKGRKRAPWITASERRAGKKKKRRRASKGSQGLVVGPPRYHRSGENPSFTWQAPKARTGRSVVEEYLRANGEVETRRVHVGALSARDVLVDRHAIRLPMGFGRVRIDDATGYRNGIADAESPRQRIPEGAVPKVVTVRKLARARWEVSVVVEEPYEVPEVPPDLPSCGIDLGMNAEATIAWSDGRIERVEPPRPMQFLGIGLVMLQRRLDRTRHVLRCVECKHEMPLGERVKRIRICRQPIERDGEMVECGGRVRRWRSWRGMRLVERIARKHNRIARVRADHLHKLTHRLVGEASLICTEPHNVTGLVSAGVARRCERYFRKGLRRRDIRRAMLDIAWGEFRRQLSYKAPWKGREYQTLPEGSASDQVCWRCGCKNKMLDGTSEYDCEGCRWHGTRQENTARACLAFVSPETVPPESEWYKEDQEAAE